MADLDKIVKDLSNLSVIEAAELSKKLEEKWGVSAAAPVAAVAAPAGAGNEAEAEEKTDFEIFLAETGSNKIAVIKEVRTITALGLKEAKDLVEAAPKSLKKDVAKAESCTFEQFHIYLKFGVPQVYVTNVNYKKQAVLKTLIHV